jgi:hypothetical protein
MKQPNNAPRRFQVKSNRRAAWIVLTAALVTMSIGGPPQLFAQNGEGNLSSGNTSSSTGQWSVQVDKVDPGDVNLAPSFQMAIYESLLDEISKTRQFKQVFRDADRSAAEVPDLLILKTTIEKYTAGSETRRAVTTVSGATKLTVRSELLTRAGKILLERTVEGNVRFMGSNLRATHNLARNVAKTMKQSRLPEPSSSALSRAINSAASDEIVVVELP